MARQKRERCQRLGKVTSMEAKYKVLEKDDKPGKWTPDPEVIVEIRGDKEIAEKIIKLLNENFALF